jgi:hypothetical protein
MAMRIIPQDDDSSNHGSLVFGVKDRALRESSLAAAIEKGNAVSGNGGSTNIHAVMMTTCSAVLTTFT